MYSSEQRRALLDIARKSITAVLRASLPLIPEAEDPELKELRGVFVSVYHGEELRGCIGRVEPTEPLYRAVGRLALAAAFQDRRFRPIKAQELEGLGIEISVLTVPERIQGPGDVVVGRDGLAVRHHGQAGLLLPQVGSRYSWTPETFLEQTCVKAGLPPDTWRDPACEIYRFEAEVFGDPDAS